MTEKELKKLSRLELLELLLEASTENQELKNHIQKLNKEIDTAKHIEQLSSAITQVENVLDNVNRLATSAPPSAPVAPSITEITDPTLLDKEIYRCLLRFYAKNKALLSMLPLELKIAINERIPSVVQ